MFKLHSEYMPTGDQPEAIEKLSKGIQEGKKFNDTAIFYKSLFHIIDTYTKGIHKKIK